MAGVDNSLRVAPIVLRNLTDMRVGSKRNVIGVIDLPFNRNVFGFPYIPGQAVKGALKSSMLTHIKKLAGTINSELKAELLELTQEIERILFGNQNGVGGLTVSDFHLIFIPVSCRECGIIFVTSPERLSLLLDTLETSVSSSGLIHVLAEFMEAGIGLAEGVILSTVNVEELHLAKGMPLDNVSIDGESITQLKRVLTNIIKLPGKGATPDIGIVNDFTFRALLEKAMILQPRIRLKGYEAPEKGSFKDSIIYNKSVSQSGPFFEEKIPKFSVFAGKIIYNKWKELKRSFIKIILNFEGQIMINFEPQDNQKINANILGLLVNRFTEKGLSLWLGANETLAFGLVELEKIKAPDNIKRIPIARKQSKVHQKNRSIRMPPLAELLNITMAALDRAFTEEEKQKDDNKREYENLTQKDLDKYRENFLQQLKITQIDKTRKNKIKSLAQLVRRLGYKPAELFYLHMKADSKAEGYPQVRVFLKLIGDYLKSRNIPTSSILAYPIIVKILSLSKHMVETIPE